MRKQKFRAVKIHSYMNWRRDIELCKSIREVVGDGVLMLDPWFAYTKEEALKVGRAIDRLGFYWYEDPLQKMDLDGCAELCRSLDVSVLLGGTCMIYMTFMVMRR